ncbi:MAG: putative spermidine/putrescine transport system ATP-binding protein [Actinomycetota bacterium]|nr:putative spermidine/putrescine transport system ATP-binding protein [Actinomycetota bacterium]
MEDVLERHMNPAADSPRDGQIDVELRGVRKAFGDTEAVRGVDLKIPSGEFFSILGPSGSGKTTCLRMIAGFEEPTQGQILLSGKDVTGLPPYDRDVNTVFQDYALFPHMTLAQNVEYGLKVKGVGRAPRKERTTDALRIVRLEGFEDRKPSELSGGQRQRVALARALVNRPRVLLLDEPLGALDLKLRQAMQIELKSIQQEVGLTFIYVTHDQEEALTMSDRLAVMNDGRIEQIGPPAEVYENPATQFVAGFVGTSNVLSGETAKAITGSSDMFTVRPEKIRITTPDETPAEGEYSIDGTIRDIVYVGALTRFIVKLETGDEMVVLHQNLEKPSNAERGGRVRLTWEREHNRPVENGSESGPAGPEGGIG